MNLKEDLLSKHILFQGKNQESKFVENIRNQSIEDFETLGFPTKKQEDWKYTNINSLLRKDYKIFPNTEHALDYKEVKRFIIHDIESYKIVFINGVYSSFLSKTTHDEADVCIISSAMKNGVYQPAIENFYHKIAQKNEGLVALNTAFAKEGAFIQIPNNTILSKPVQILYFSTGIDEKAMYNHRNLIVVGDNSEVQIIERHQTLNQKENLTNIVTEIAAGKNANIDYCKIQNDSEESSLIDHTFVQQERDSTVSVHTFSIGGNITRNTLHFYQNGENCNSILSGISLGGQNQLIDHHTLVNHKFPNCESHELYRGIFDDDSKGVFNGKVIVHSNAQKINAFQQNNNILLSNKSSIDTKPQLEIFADDVKCSHGCTVGQLDKEALFYMQSRGIPEKKARALLMFAFTADVLGNVKIPEVKNRINLLIAKKLGVELDFEL